MHGWLDEDCFNTEASTESEEELTKRADQTASVNGLFLTVSNQLLLFLAPQARNEKVRSWFLESTERQRATTVYNKPLAAQASTSRYARSFIPLSCNSKVTHQDQ